MASKPVVICGAGGFIGGHLVKALIGQRAIRAVDIKPLGQWYQVFPEAENLVLDLRLKQTGVQAVRGADTVYNLAADMGGMGFIENNKALCMLSILINTHLLMAAKDAGVRRFFFSSSACAYNIERQKSENVVPLRETDAYPAMPEGLRLGKAVQRAHVPSLHGGLRTRNTRGSLPQCLWSSRDL